MAWVSNVRSGWIEMFADVEYVIRKRESGEQGVWIWKSAFVKKRPPEVTSKQKPKPLFVKPQ